MGHDRVTEIRVAGLRVLKQVRLGLNGLTVLIGENGTGKSSLVEACEILCRIGNRSEFIDDLYRIHQAPTSLFRSAPDEPLKLGVRLEGVGPAVDYDIELVSDSDDRISIVRESITLLQPPHDTEIVAMERSQGLLRSFATGQSVLVEVSRSLPPQHLALHAFGVINVPAIISRVLRALQAIDVQIAFDVLPTWVARSARRHSPLREPALGLRAQKLELLGENLVNAYAALKNDHSSTWAETMELVRLGLGPDIESVNTISTDEGGKSALRLKLRGSDKQIPVANVSDGMLAYLAFVALVQIPSTRSLLVFDEPELHLHSDLLMRVLSFFDRIARSVPVVLATHSDRLLDALETPAESAVLCEIDASRSTVLRRPDPKSLQQWLERFRGLGTARSEGFVRSIMTREEEGKGRGT